MINATNRADTLLFLLGSPLWPLNIAVPLQKIWVLGWASQWTDQSSNTRMTSPLASRWSSWSGLVGLPLEPWRLRLLRRKLKPLQPGGRRRSLTWQPSLPISANRDDPYGNHEATELSGGSTGRTYIMQDSFHYIRGNRYLPLQLHSGILTSRIMISSPQLHTFDDLVNLILFPVHPISRCYCHQATHQPCVILVSSPLSLIENKRKLGKFRTTCTREASLIWTSYLEKLTYL
jgi:hypothetical protein